MKTRKQLDALAASFGCSIEDGDSVLCKFTKPNGVVVTIYNRYEFFAPDGMDLGDGCQSHFCTNLREVEAELNHIATYAKNGISIFRKFDD